ncbi:MAG: methylmalonyl-CoA mutase subunit beta [Methylocapsa sp.]|nr:methylmalonyl-CoA mutase subunit beta [Methylocapsa sp.]
MVIRTAQSFPPASENEWRRLVEKALGGRPFESLLSATFEGLEIAPLYPRAAEESVRPLRQNHGPWKIAQRIDHPDPEAANVFARADLESGADALTLAFSSAHAGRGFGIKIAGERDLKSLVAGIELDLIPLRLDAGSRVLELAPYLAAIARERRLTSAALDIDFGYDPIGDTALSRPLCARPAGSLREIHALLRDAGFSGRLLLADGRPYHEAGAGEAQELACVIATGVEYLRLLETEGLPLEDAQDEIAFLLPADADEFLSLSKFRALRMLWAHVESQCGLAPKPIRLHAETSFRMMTRYDPWTNILRAAMGVFASGTGGADTITTLPFTLALGLPDGFARRIARNTQLILIHEAQLAKVADPAAGAGSCEALTETLCSRAWALFQNFEARGGILAALQLGLPQGEIGETARARREGLAHRAPPVTGTSAFPLISEAEVNVLMPAPPESAGDQKTLALALQRDAWPYEILRCQVDAHAGKSGQRPKIFLVKLGPGHEGGRAMDEAANFFAIAGIDSVRADITSGEITASSFRASGCKIACICASPAVPTQTLSEAARAYQAAGAARVYLAGRSSHEDATALQRAGISEFIWTDCDAVAILNDAKAAVLP